MTQKNPSRASESRASLFDRALAALPTLLILAALAGLAFWGHHTGWRFGAPPRSKSDETESKHWLAIVPEGKGFGWCEQHGIHECPLCHPEVAEVKPTPRITAEDRERARRGLDLTPRPRNDPACTLYRRRVHFASTDDVRLAGIDTTPAWYGNITETVTAPGEIVYDQTRYARLSARVPGAVWRVLKRIGDRFDTGEVLAVIDAAEVGKAKAEFLQAHAQVGLRTRTLDSLRAAGRAVPERQLREAETALHEAQIRLVTGQQALGNLGLRVQLDELRNLTSEMLTRRIQFAGLPESLTKALDPASTTANLLPVVSPLAGEVLACDVVAGEVVDAARVLFVVADTRQVWLSLGVRPEDAERVQQRQMVAFRPDGVREEVRGRLTWISTAVEEKSRTVRARAELANPGDLRSGVFGVGRVILREEPRAIVVPSEAVQSDRDCHFVFVRGRDFLDPDTAKVFLVRTVRIGVRDEKQTEILAGLLPGEVVATKGSVFLRTEARRNLIGGLEGGHPHDEGKR
jgi:cobalt-zinc-cadmium efflux system membrane fusion protein